MHYQAVIDQFALPVSLDPLTATLFLAALLAVAALTARRPAFGLVALIAAQPFAFARDVAGTTISLPKIVLLGVLLGLFTYVGAFARLRDERAPRAILVAMVAYALAIALTILVAADRHVALRETLKALEYLLLFATAYLAYRLDPDDALTVGSVGAVTIVVAMSALVQEAIGAPSGLCIGTAIVPRIAGVLEGPNQLAGYLEIAIATLVVWSAARRWVLGRAALVLAGLTLVLTFSRAGLAATAIVLVVIAVAQPRAALTRAAWPLAGIALGGVGALAWSLGAHAPGLLRLSLASSRCAGGVGARPELWHAAWFFFMHHPWLGIGAGNFDRELPLAGVYGVRTHANSWYLQSLAEGGVLLFAATLGVIGAWLATFARGLRDASPWQLAACAATLALALHQIFDYLLFYPKVGGPLMLLAGIGAATLARRSA